MTAERLQLPEPAGALWTRVREPLKRALESLGAPMELKLGGGTVLAARWKHRSSHDIDIVVPEKTNLWTGVLPHAAQCGVGLMQVAAGVLLLIPGTALLGALLYLPIIVNIFVITVAMEFRGTWVIVGAMLLANLYLLAWDYDRLRNVLFREPPPLAPDHRPQRRGLGA